MSALLVLGTVHASDADAFTSTWAWHGSASGPPRGYPNDTVGSGGIYGTGGASDHGMVCGDCHIPTNHDGTPVSQSVDLSVTPSPAFGDRGGEWAYTPGQRYTITVRLHGEHLRDGWGSGRPGGESINGFGLTIEDASGTPVGRFVSDAGQDSDACPPSDPGPTAGATTLVYGDCHGVLYQPHLNLDTWTFDWIAPTGGSGDLQLFVAVVDGNEIHETSLGDDSLARVYALREGT